MVLPDSKHIESHLVSELYLFQEVRNALIHPDLTARLGVEPRLDKRVDTDFHGPELGAIHQGGNRSGLE